MATLNEYIFRIQNKINGGRTSANSRPSRREIAFAILYWRAEMIKQTVAKHNALSDSFFSCIEPIEMERFDERKSRSVKEIPRIIRINSSASGPTEDGIRSIYSPYDKADLYHAPDFVAKWQKYRMYTCDWNRPYLDCNRLWVENGSHIEKLGMKAIFFDPRDAAKFGETCYNDDMNFPMPEDMGRVIVDGIVEGELKLKGIEDTENDDQDA